MCVCVRLANGHVDRFHPCQKVNINLCKEMVPAKINVEGNGSIPYAIVAFIICKLVSLL